MLGVNKPLVALLSRIPKKLLLTSNTIILMLLLQLTIGNVGYHCSCVQYILHDYSALIVGVSIAVTVLIFITILIITLRRQCLRKPISEGYTDVTVDQNEHYSLQLPDYHYTASQL